MASGDVINIRAGHKAWSVFGSVNQYSSETGEPVKLTLPFLDTALIVDPDGLDCFAALDWRYQLVDWLEARDVDLKKIIDWILSSDPRPLIRLVEGPGGAGKTRLAAEAVKR